MARPLKNDAERFNRRLPHVRCTENELELVQHRAERAGLSISEYVRRMALFGEVTIQQTRFDFQLVEQLRRIGVNINQQTRSLNSTGAIPVELKRLWGKLESLLDEIMTTPK